MRFKPSLSVFAWSVGTIAFEHRRPVVLRMSWTQTKALFSQFSGHAHVAPTTLLHIPQILMDYMVLEFKTLTMLVRGLVSQI